MSEDYTSLTTGSLPTPAIEVSGQDDSSPPRPPLSLDLTSINAPAPSGGLSPLPSLSPAQFTFPRGLPSSGLAVKWYDRITHRLVDVTSWTANYDLDSIGLGPQAWGVQFKHDSDACTRTVMLHFRANSQGALHNIYPRDDSFPTEWCHHDNVRLLDCTPTTIEAPHREPTHDHVRSIIDGLDQRIWTSIDPEFASFEPCTRRGSRRNSGCATPASPRVYRRRSSHGLPTNTLETPQSAAGAATPQSPFSIERPTSMGDSFWNILEHRLQGEDADRSDLMQHGRTSSDEPGSSPVIAPDQDTAPASPGAMAESYGDCAGVRASDTPELSTASETDAGATHSERAGSSESLEMEYYLDPARFDSV